MTEVRTLAEIEEAYHATGGHGITAEELARFRAWQEARYEQAQRRRGTRNWKAVQR